MLSCLPDCHINVEICASVKAIKYIHKYIYKGHDCTTLEITREGEHAIDEVKEYVDAHYISAIESCWHIFEFPMHSEKPIVYHLAVHLPDQQLVYYDPGDILDEIVDRESSKTTTLTAWFDANKNHEQAGRQPIMTFLRLGSMIRKRRSGPHDRKALPLEGCILLLPLLESVFTSGPSSLLLRVPLLLRICTLLMVSSVPLPNMLAKNKASSMMIKSGFNV